jgi:hypothetical protein
MQPSVESGESAAVIDGVARRPELEEPAEATE